MKTITLAVLVLMAMAALWFAPAHAQTRRVAALTSEDFDDRSLLTTQVKAGEVTLELPAFFDAKLFATLNANARHLTVRDDGTVYVRLGRAAGGGSIVALKDTDGDKRADREIRFVETGGTGVHVHKGHLYYSTDTAIFRRPFKGGALIPVDNEQTVVSGLPRQRSHAAKPLAFDGAGHMFTMVGAPSNACMKQPRTQGSPGLKPCPQLKEHGTIWRFRDDALNQRFSDGERFATGLRQVVALDWNPGEKRLFAVQHGRDQLHDLFPKYFTTRESAELPAEELLALKPGFVGGWPYTYYDWRTSKRMIAPEYGGNGKRVEKPGRYPDPVQAFPGHYAPNDLVFYNAKQFPEQYRGAGFVAFHGSWNRAPHRQRGYHIAWIPKNGGKPKIFVTGFSGRTKLATPGDAKHRPMGIAVGPDGELYVSDSVRGAIWRIDYLG
ncbi:MAG: sorbosone dehydrogenase [Myxococcota bacterium]